MLRRQVYSLESSTFSLYITVDTNAVGEWLYSLEGQPLQALLVVSRVLGCICIALTQNVLISGILAYAIGKMDGIGGRKGWEWCVLLPGGFDLASNRFHRIFILEGILTVAVSLLAYFIVPTWSHNAKFVCHVATFAPSDAKECGLSAYGG